MISYVQAKVTVAGVHERPDAPKRLVHQSYPHRHLFVIRATKAASFHDRTIDVQDLKAAIEHYLRQTNGMFNEEALYFGTRTCEDIALGILTFFDLQMCSVHEDDENGAVVVRPNEPVVNGVPAVVKAVPEWVT